MNFYTLASREERELSRKKKDWLTQHASSEEDGVPADIIAKMEDQMDALFERTYKRAVKRMLAARDINVELGLTVAKTNRRFFITIRPDNRKITFTDFYKLVHKLVHRNCFTNYMLTFEQKGESEDTLGHGFHVHMVAEMTQKGKAEVVRDVHNSVKGCTEKHCIQVDITYNGEQMFNNYCVEYESKDGHKEKTKQWDTMWRNSIGLADYYNNDMPQVCVPAIKSDAGTYIVEID